MTTQKSSRIPKYRLHTPSGLAVVRLNDRDIYLGKHGTQESRQEYGRLIKEWLTNNKLLVPADEGRRPGVRLTKSTPPTATHGPSSRRATGPFRRRRNFWATTKVPSRRENCISGERHIVSLRTNFATTQLPCSDRMFVRADRLDHACVERSKAKALHFSFKAFCLPFRLSP
jgi:hypothetical protein